MVDNTLANQLNLAALVIFKCTKISNTILKTSADKNRAFDVAELNLLELGLDWKSAIQRVAKDVRDDFWTDPLVFTDLLGSGDTDSSRLEPLLKSYRPRQGFSYCIPTANFTIRDSIHISALDRIVYQALFDRARGRR